MSNSHACIGTKTALFLIYIHLDDVLVSKGGRISLNFVHCFLPSKDIIACPNSVSAEQNDIALCQR